MLLRKKLNFKKPFTKKKRINIFIIFNNKRFLFDQIERNKIITKMNIFVTFVIKALNLKFVIKSHIIITSLLKFNESKFFER